MRRGYGDEAREQLAKARALALGASLSFSGMYVCVKLLSPGVSSFEALFARGHGLSYRAPRNTGKLVETPIPAACP